MSSPTDTRDSLKPTCLQVQIIESIEKMRDEMNMSPKTSKLADKLRNQASAAIAREQDQPDDRRTLELAWNMFQILIEKSKECAAEEKQILKKRAAEAEELQKIQEETRKLQNKLAQTEKEINTKEKAPESQLGSTSKADISIYMYKSLDIVRKDIKAREWRGECRREQAPPIPCPDLVNSMSKGYWRNKASIDSLHRYCFR